MKKFRGKKRYYKNLLNKDLDVYFGNLDFDSWFDFWHDHPDWYGYGNFSWKQRKQHLEALILQFNYLKEKLSSRTNEFQLFCIVDLKDASQDSVFIHTENPNEKNFPVKFEKSAVSPKILNNLSEFLNESKYEWFFHVWERENEAVTQIFIFDSNVGISIINN